MVAVLWKVVGDVSTVTLCQRLFANKAPLNHVGRGCGKPPGIKNNGRVRYQSTRLGSVAVYRCYRPYSLVGTGRRTCLRNGTWSGKRARCSTCGLIFEVDSPGCSGTAEMRVSAVWHLNLESGSFDSLSSSPLSVKTQPRNSLSPWDSPLSLLAMIWHIYWHKQPIQICVDSANNTSVSLLGVA